MCLSESSGLMHYFKKFIWNVGDFKLRDLDGKMLLEIDVNLFILQQLQTSFENIQFSSSM